MRLFGMTEQHRLMKEHQTVQVFNRKLTGLQRQVLRSLGEPLSAYADDDAQ